jgi:putative DNA methylase
MWEGARGIADDVRFYGQWMRDRAYERIGHLYPKVRVKQHNGEDEATVIAWLWARTVLCPNPACGARMPMVRSFELSAKPSTKAWVEPLVDHSTKVVRFEVRTDGTTPTTATKQRGAGRCIFCGTAVNDATMRKQAVDSGLTVIPMAVIAEGVRGRVYLGTESFHIPEIPRVDASWLEHEMPDNARWFSPPGYGLRTYRDLFTDRQLVMLTTFADLIQEARGRAIADGASAQYADALATYLSFAVDKVSEGSTTLCTWSALPTKLHVVSTFGRHALPMVWDFAEANPFADSSGNFGRMVNLIADVIDRNCCLGTKPGHCNQLDATSASETINLPMFSTDPPYYDNIGYADLSDFFYVSLRRSLQAIYPSLFATLLTPKKQELIASPYRFAGDREAARAFFEDGLLKAFSRMREFQNPEYPLTIFYAFKQAEDETGEESRGLASTGWETMLEGLMQSNHQVTGTWPMRTERSGGFRNKDQNALASSIILVCRPRPDNAGIATRRDFLSALKKELPHALRNMQKGNIAPVDLAQAAIGPGMAIFSRYKRVVESDGSAMRVRTALASINQTLDEVLSEQESEFDSDTRWALAWFEQYAFNEGPYGQAEVLATAKALSISVLDETKILQSRAGKVRLLEHDLIRPRSQRGRTS